MRELNRHDGGAAHIFIKEIEMFKFKKDDLGFYIVCAIGGGGVGFLAGSIFVALRAKRRQKRIEEEWMQAEFDLERERVPLSDLTEEGLIEAVDIVKDKGYIPEEDGEDGEDVYDESEFVYHDLSKDEEVEEFIDTHELNEIQEKMLRAGDLSIDEVKETLREGRPKKDYSAMYGRNEKPDLDQVLPDENFEDDSPDSEEVIDDRWKLNESLPVDKKTQNVKVVYWDEEDDSFYRNRRGNKTTPINIAEYISESAWTAVRYWFDLGWETIYVDDRETVRVIRVEKVTTETEGFVESSDS
jgi:hypothetical protein